ncbi:MAG: glucose-6-phosphate isomerase family protein, partial [Candidatus Desantisbacteria bacterium]
MALKYNAQDVKTELGRIFQVRDVTRDLQEASGIDTLEINPEGDGILLDRGIVQVGKRIDKGSGVIVYEGLYTSEEDKLIAEKQGIQYNLTVIKPDAVTAVTGQSDKPIACEFYFGSGIVTFQKQNLLGAVTEVALVEVKQGDKLVIPAGYKHRIQGFGNQPLIFGNWAVKGAKEEVLEPEGFAITVSHAKDGTLRLEQNSQYSGLGLVNAHWASPGKALKDLGLDRGPIYNWVSDLSHDELNKRVDFMRHPKRRKYQAPFENSYEIEETGVESAINQWKTRTQELGLGLAGVRSGVKAGIAAAARVTGREISYEGLEDSVIEKIDELTTQIKTWRSGFAEGSPQALALKQAEAVLNKITHPKPRSAFDRKIDSLELQIDQAISTLRGIDTAIELLQKMAGLLKEVKDIKDVKRAGPVMRTIAEKLSNLGESLKVVSDKISPLFEGAGEKLQPIINALSKVKDATHIGELGEAIGIEDVEDLQAGLNATSQALIEARTAIEQIRLSANAIAWGIDRVRKAQTQRQRRVALKQLEKIKAQFFTVTQEITGWEGALKEVAVDLYSIASDLEKDAVDDEEMRGRLTEVLERLDVVKQNFDQLSIEQPEIKEALKVILNSLEAYVLAEQCLFGEDITTDRIQGLLSDTQTRIQQVRANLQSIPQERLEADATLFQLVSGLQMILGPIDGLISQSQALAGQAISQDRIKEILDKVKTKISQYRTKILTRTEEGSSLLRPLYAGISTSLEKLEGICTLDEETPDEQLDLLQRLEIASGQVAALLQTAEYAIAT